MKFGQFSNSSTSYPIITISIPDAPQSGAICIFFVFVLHLNELFVPLFAIRIGLVQLRSHVLSEGRSILICFDLQLPELIFCLLQFFLQLRAFFIFFYNVGRLLSSLFYTFLQFFVPFEQTVEYFFSDVQAVNEVCFVELLQIHSIFVIYIH